MQRAVVVGFRSFWPWGARVGPHTRSQKLGAIRQTAQVLAVEGGGFDMAGGDPRRMSPLCIRQTCPFFARATVPYEGTHAKIRPVSSAYGFSTIYRAENPENAART